MSFCTVTFLMTYRKLLITILWKEIYVCVHLYVVEVLDSVLVKEFKYVRLAISLRRMDFLVLKFQTEICMIVYIEVLFSVFVKAFQFLRLAISLKGKDYF